MGVRQLIVRTNCRGRAAQALVEYALILMLIAVVVLAVLASIGGGASNNFSSVNTNLQ
jgi:Flp pilus assembly pilin Flp